MGPGRTICRLTLARTGPGTLRPWPHKQCCLACNWLFVPRYLYELNIVAAQRLGQLYVWPKTVQFEVHLMLIISYCSTLDDLEYVHALDNEYYAKKKKSTKNVSSDHTVYNKLQ